MILDSDSILLKAYLRREAEDYQWRDGIDGPGSLDFQQRMFDAITHYESDQKVDFVVICSITNIGLVQRELRLTAKEWDFGRNLIVNLPPNPRNGTCNFSIQERK